MNTTTETIFITNAIGTGSTFAVTAGDQPSQVYIPASIAIACELKIGGSYTATLVPNAHEKAGKTPWLCVRIEDTQEVPDPTHGDTQGFSDVFEALAPMEFPVPADEAGIPRERLEHAWLHGQVIKVEARQRPDVEPRVLWASSWEVV